MYTSAFRNQPQQRGVGFYLDAVDKDTDNFHKGINDGPRAMVDDGIKLCAVDGILSKMDHQSPFSSFQAAHNLTLDSRIIYTTLAPEEDMYDCIWGIWMTYKVSYMGGLYW
ncbi:predicted protein [Lichtheimia corymbifera JMRC:FSU:9682]|uniref:Uncharacterized protein n=1 Tax=Lichtheimia corymbifera JMRC:FSU:9682 TaxID=1263082 RepID=A0A068SHC9_9FUNG|nr:predicted protein [Lichtheimia corymbifera JMRC:FSU:9682]